MSKRSYNIFFHLHTVSGIVITVGLFVIFFAGAFTLFMKEIEAWENSKKYQIETVKYDQTTYVDLNRLVSNLEKKGYDLYGRNIYMDLVAPGALQSFYLSESDDSLAVGESKKSKDLLFNRETYEISEKPKTSTYTLSELLYELHFFYQLGDPGYYLAGLVSLFFLFAMVSGIIVHWKKIVSNFYVFRPKEKLKTVWTDAHTALGVIGIPFQFMYALTGAWFGLGILVSTTGALLYGGDESKFDDAIYGHHEAKLGPRVRTDEFDLNKLYSQASTKWPDYRLTYLSMEGIGSSNMKMNVYGEVSSKFSFFNYGEVEFDVKSGNISHMHDPYHKTYDEMVSAAVHRLHFGYFGLEGWAHIAVKTLYFLLSIATCFVIITGVLIWLEARNKKNIEPKKKKYNQRVGYIYLAVCLSMLPITALAFIVSKLIPDGYSEHKAAILNSVYFGGWLLLSVYLIFQKNNYTINRYTLFSSGLIGLCIPLINGIMTGQWMWETMHARTEIFLIDALWLFLSITCLYIVFRTKKPVVLETH